MSVTGLPALDNTMGVLFLSAVLSMALWGAASIQFYYYFNGYPDDHTWMKALVVVIWMADTASQALITQISYSYLVTHYAEVTYLGHLESTLLPIMLLTGMLSLGVQAFFLVRIWRLSKKNWIVTGAVTLVCAAQFVSTAVFFGIGKNFTEFVQLTPHTNLMHVINALSAAADASIAAALCFLLHGSRSGFRRSEKIINRLIFFTINTGLLTGVCAILTLIFNVALPNTFIYMIFYILVARIYTNSLLATLNSRESIRRGMPDNTTSNMVNSMPANAINMHTISNRPKPRAMTIKVDTETHRDDGFDKHAPSETDVETGYSSSTKAQAF